MYIIVSWLNPLHSPILPPPLTVQQCSGQIPDLAMEGTDGYGGKDYEKRKVLRQKLQ